MNLLQQIYDDIVSPEVTLWGALFKLVLSMLLGAVVGLERRRKGQVAGLRTFALIAMGATLAMLISIYIPQVYLGLKNGDPGRIAAQVVSGVGFLGAGAIIQMKGSVRGLTTAAGIWMTACLGLAVGAGMYLISILATLLIIFILVNIERIEQRTGFSWESRVIRVKLQGIVTDLDACKQAMEQNHIHVSDALIKYDNDNELTIVNYMVRMRGRMPLDKVYAALNSAYTLKSLSLTNETNF